MTLKLIYCFQTEDAAVAYDIAQRLGIPMSLVHSAQGAIPATPAAPAATAPTYAATLAAPAATAPTYAAPAPAAGGYGQTAAAPPAAPAAAPPPPAAGPAPHDAADQAIIDSGWSLEAHMKPLAMALGTKFPDATGPGRLKAILQQVAGVEKLSLCSPKHWPAVHAAVSAIVNG